MIALTVVSLIFLQLNIPTPKDYTVAFLGSIYAIGSGLLIWSLQRNVKTSDDKIKQLEETIKEEGKKKEDDRREYLAAISKIDTEVDRLKDDMTRGRADTNERISTMALRISNDIKDLAVKIASGIHINDNNSK